VTSAVSIPVIACGGAGAIDDLGWRSETVGALQRWPLVVFCIHGAAPGRAD